MDYGALTIRFFFSFFNIFMFKEFNVFLGVEVNALNYRWAK